MTAPTLPFKSLLCLLLLLPFFQPAKWKLEYSNKFSDDDEDDDDDVEVNNVDEIDECNTVVVGPQEDDKEKANAVVGVVVMKVVTISGKINCRAIIIIILIF